MPSGTWRCADGRYVVIGGNGDSVYARLMAAIGRPEMGPANAAYATNRFLVVLWLCVSFVPCLRGRGVGRFADCHRRALVNTLLPTPTLTNKTPTHTHNTKSDRVAREAEIMDAIGAWVARHTLDEVVDAMRAARVASFRR